MHSESIPSRLVLLLLLLLLFCFVFFLIFTFIVTKAPMWRICDAGVFPWYTGDIREEFLYLVLEGSWGLHNPPHIFWKINAIFTIQWRGGLVVNTLAYHTGDPGSIPGRGGSSEKCEGIWGDFSSPACNPPSLIRGYTKGTGGDGRIICVRTVSCDQAQ